MCVADTSHDPTNPKFQQYFAAAVISRKRSSVACDFWTQGWAGWAVLGRRRSRVDLTVDRRRVSALLFGCVPCLRISASLAKQTLLEADQRGCEDAVHNDAAQADFAVHRGHECDKGECAAGMAWSPSRPVALRCFFSSLSARYPRAFDPICLCPRPALTMGLGRCNSISRTRITIWTPPSTSRCNFFPSSSSSCWCCSAAHVWLARPMDARLPSPSWAAAAMHGPPPCLWMGVAAGLGAESRSWEYGRGTRG